MDTKGVRPCWVVSFGDLITLLPSGWDTQFYEDDAFRVGNDVKLSGDGYHWERRGFGHYRIRSFAPDDREAFENAVGRPEFGTNLRTSRAGVEENYVLADYYEGVIATLPVPDPRRS